MKRIPKSEVLHKKLNQILEGAFDDLTEGKLEDREFWLSMVMEKRELSLATTIRERSN